MHVDDDFGAIAPPVQCTITPYRGLGTYLRSLSLRPGMVVRELMGRRMRTLDTLFQEFGAAMQFPPYYGANWPALMECLTDLEWLPGESYLIVLWDFWKILSGNDADIKTLYRVLVDCATEWAQGVSDGEWWDRPGKTFRILLHSLPEDQQMFHRRLQTLGVDPPIWSLPSKYEAFNSSSSYLPIRMRLTRWPGTRLGWRTCPRSAKYDEKASYWHEVACTCAISMRAPVSQVASGGVGSKSL